MDRFSFPLAERHFEIILDCEALHPDERFVLINDHDPEHLFHQLESGEDQVCRKCRFQEPEVGHVRIGKHSPG